MFHLDKQEKLQGHCYLIVMEKVLPGWQYERPLYDMASHKTEETKFCGFSSACEIFNNIRGLSAAAVFISEYICTQL